MASLAVVFAYHLLSSIIFKFCNCQDTLLPSQSLQLGRTLVSSNGTFELGFFTPDADTNSSWYLGLWYTNITPKKVVWVANREFPLYDTFGAMNFTRQGVLVIFSSTNSVVWSSKVSTIAKDPVLQLLDSGNLVVKERFGNDPDHYIWQSFDYICDTLLPGMKLGRNFSSSLEWYMSSWKSSEDPASGIFWVSIDVHGYPQLVVKNGSRVQYRVGSWNGITFTGTPFLQPTSMLTMTFEMNDQVVYFEFKFSGSSDFTRFALDSTGLVQRYVWKDRSYDWVVIATAETDDCENYALCGAYGICNISRSPICACLDGFISRSPEEWNSSNWSGGCVRRTPLECQGKDGFLKLGGIKLPDTSYSWFNRSVSLEECEGLCLRNCSCTAYASLDIRGSGCLLWYGEIVDVRALSEGGQDLYVRLAASELDSIQQLRPTSRRKNQGLVIAISVVLVVAILVGLGLCLLGTGILKTAMARKRELKHERLGGMEEEMEMPIFDLATIEEATKNFSNVNKLGEGGFGPVYKGKLYEGKEIAVKRLSKISSQGLNEFKTEVMVISKLQHRNLVRLLGCCVHEDEKMLIYEYMPNKSLDDFIFDKTRSKLLDWHKRFCIIEGIARGLLYLHQDSRLRIIHRDLKASNILLDDHMNPKISDFGLARTFGADQTEANTDTVVGTFGYMAPEYAMDGHFSVKSDVFSFGVLILEIISGRKNQGFFHPGHDFNLLGHAWMLWNKRTPLELIDEYLAESCTPFEVIRCIHIALLCVQQRPWDRPFLSTVVLMLGSDNQLPEPKQPGFSMGRNSLDARNALWSENGISETVLEAR